MESFHLFPVKENRKTAFYFALDREEKIPSLSVDFVKNKAFDFGTGKSYDVISIVQQMNQCSVSEALKYLEKFDFSVQNEFHNEELMQKKEYEILNVCEIQHPALIQYLKFRKVYEQKDLVKEIEYELNGKKYFGIGFFGTESYCYWRIILKVVSCTETACFPGRWMPISKQALPLFWEGSFSPYFAKFSRRGF